jgi:hypothetical protein
MVLHLPKQLLGSIFSTSLSLKDVVRLGRAMCSHESRAMYSEALCSTVVNIDLMGDKLELLRWALVRRVKIKEIKLLRTDAALSKLLEKNVHDVTARNLEGEEILTVEHKYLATKITFLDVGEHDLLHCARISNLVQLVCVLSLSNVECMAAFIQHNPLLRTLGIMAAVLSQKVLEQRSVKLLELCLETSSELNDAVLVQIAGSYPNLQRLELIVSSTFATTRLSVGLTLLAQRCCDLSSFALTGGFSAEDHELQEFLRHAHQLETFDMSAIDLVINDAALLALLESNNGEPHVTALLAVVHLQYEETIRRCASALAYVRKFKFIRLMTRSPLLELLLEHLCNLEWLMLRAEMLTMLPPSSCANLQWLKIQGTCDVGDFLPAFVKHTPALKYLCLCNTRSAGTGALLTSLSKHCPSLQSLTVERGVSVTKKSLLSLIWGCPKLTNLAMPVGKAMTYRILKALAQHSYYLQELHLHREAVVTEAALVQLVTSCKHLTKLQDNQSSSITKELQQKLVQACAARGRRLECVVYAPVVWLLAPYCTAD